MLSAALTRSASVSMSAANWVTASSARSSPSRRRKDGLAGDVQTEGAEHDQGRGVKGALAWSRRARAIVLPPTGIGVLASGAGRVKE